jgi:hypothetical protein
VEDDTTLRSTADSHRLESKVFPGNDAAPVDFARKVCRMFSYRCSSFLWLAVSLAPTIADAQTYGGVGGVGRRGTGVRGGSGLRSGAGLQNNPVANPAPSLTPHQVLNPRGSLSTGQVLNPRPSLAHPRSGDALSLRSAYPLRLGVTGSNAGRLHTMSRSELARFVDANARRLSSELDRLETGDALKNDLKLDELRKLAATVDRDPHSDVKRDVQAISRRLDEVSESEEDAPISRLPSFQSLRLVMSELDRTQAERAWAELVQLNAQLQRAMGRFQHADRWKSYLAIPAAEADGREQQSPSNQDLRVIQSRFDQVAGIEKYRPLTGMAIFQATRDQLSSYISRFGEESSP